MIRTFKMAAALLACSVVVSGCNRESREPFTPTPTPADAVYFDSLAALRESSPDPSEGSDVFAQQLPSTDLSTVRKIASTEGVEYWASFDRGEVCFATRALVEAVHPETGDPADLGIGWTLASHCEPESTFEEDGIEIDAATSSRTVRAILVPDGFTDVGFGWTRLTQNVHIR